MGRTRIWDLPAVYRKLSLGQNNYYFPKVHSYLFIRGTLLFVVHVLHAVPKPLSRTEVSESKPEM